MKSQQSRPSRVATWIASALTAALVLAGCSSGTEEEDVQQDAVEVPVTTPASFANSATWSAEVDADAPAIMTDIGILTLVPASGLNKYSPALIHPTTGEPRWTGRPIDGSNELPEIGWVQQGDRHWAVLVATLEGDNATVVYAYDGDSNDEERPTASSARFDGEESPPRVRVSASGILVSGSDMADHLQYHPASGRVTEFGTAPIREGEIEGESTEVEGQPLQVYRGGWLLNYPDLGFGYASSDGGWESLDNVPPGADSEGGESILRTGSGYILALWPGQDEDDDTQVLSVHRAQDGEVVARLDMDRRDQQAFDDQREREVTYDLLTDQDWLVWGEFAFNLHSGEGEHIDLGLGAPTAVIEGMVYVHDAQRPQQESATPQEDPTPSPPLPPGATETATEEEGTPEGTEEAEPPSPDPVDPTFNGFLAVDLASQSSQPGVHEITPVGVSPYGQGVFIHEDTIYSIPFR